MNPPSHLGAHPHHAEKSPRPADHLRTAPSTTDNHVEQDAHCLLIYHPEIHESLIWSQSKADEESWTAAAMQSRAHISRAVPGAAAVCRAGLDLQVAAQGRSSRRVGSRVAALGFSRAAPIYLKDI